MLKVMVPVPAVGAGMAHTLTKASVDRTFLISTVVPLPRLQLTVLTVAVELEIAMATMMTRFEPEIVKLPVVVPVLVAGVTAATSPPCATATG